MQIGKTVFTMAAVAGLATIAATGLGRADTSRPRALAPETSPHFGKLALPLQASFAPGTTPREMVEAYRKLMEMYGVGLEHLVGNTDLEFVGSDRWTGTPGTPINITYSFVPDGVGTSNGVNVLHQILTSSVGPEELWKARFAQAFNEWTEDTANTYTEVGDDGAPWNGSPGNQLRGDIRIVSADIDGPSNVLAFNFFPNNGDMLLDRDENWGSGSTDLFMRQVITHENGHGMGLSHSCPQQATKIMEPSINLNFEGPQRDDRLAMQFRYGDKMEPNNSLGSAKALESFGLVSDSTLTIDRLSLRDTNDGDFFTFEAVAGSVINEIQVAPQGQTYLISGQNGVTGACNPGQAWDSLRQLDVVFDILSSNGQTITTVNSQGLGGVETLNDFALPNDGTYYIRVRSTGPGQSVTPIQEYRLRVNISLEALLGDLNGDGFVNGVDLAVLLSAWGSDGSTTGADLSGDLIVNGVDLAILLTAWTGGS